MTNSNKGCIEPERTREIERPDDERGHHHRRDERAGGEARAQHRIGNDRHWMRVMLRFARRARERPNRNSRQSA
jgi:hypothetical protein